MIDGLFSTLLIPNSYTLFKQQIKLIASIAKRVNISSFIH